MMDESELLPQAVTVFSWSSKKHGFCIILIEDYAFSVDKFRMVSTECNFQLAYLGVVLSGIDHLVFWKELVIEDSLPILPYTVSPSLEKDWPLV